MCARPVRPHPLPLPPTPCTAGWTPTWQPGPHLGCPPRLRRHRHDPHHRFPRGLWSLRRHHLSRHHRQCHRCHHRPRCCHRCRHRHLRPSHHTRHLCLAASRARAARIRAAQRHSHSWLARTCASAPICCTSGASAAPRTAPTATRRMRAAAPTTGPLAARWAKPPNASASAQSASRANRATSRVRQMSRYRSRREPSLGSRLEP